VVPMTVGRLKKILEDFPEDLIVIYQPEDGDYSEARLTSEIPPEHQSEMEGCQGYLVILLGKTRKL